MMIAAPRRAALDSDVSRSHLRRGVGVIRCDAFRLTGAQVPPVVMTVASAVGSMARNEQGRVGDAV